MASKKQPTVGADNLRAAMGYVGEDDVCALLGVTLSTLRTRMSNGNAPPSYKVGGRHLFNVAEIDAWIKRRRVARGGA